MRFEAFWGMKLDDQPGYTVVEIMHKASRPRPTAQGARHVHHGREPGHERPRPEPRAPRAGQLEHLVVQDIFLTETAWLADVVLPASAWPEKTGTVTNTDRTVQMGRQALDAAGRRAQDLWIIQQMAQRFGLGWGYENPKGDRTRLPRRGTCI
jgi:formate dehydrogenase major subunit